MPNLKNEKGITIIALILMIIILLILTKVSVAILAGSDGIINETEKNMSVAEINSLKEKIREEIKQEEIKAKLLGKEISDETIKNILNQHGNNYTYRVPIYLDNQGAENAGTAIIYENYGKNFSDNDNETLEEIIIPTKTDNNGIQLFFDGYYTEPGGKGVKYIDYEGHLTNDADHSNFIREGTLYAYWKTDFEFNYIPLDYIEGTGTQYIIINNLSTVNMGFEIEMSVNSGTGANVFGGYKYGQSIFCYMGTRNGTLSYFPNSSSVNFTAINYSNKHSYKLIKNNSNEFKYYYDNVLVGTSNLVNNVGCSLAIFTFIDNNGVPRTATTETFSGRIYKFILYDADTKVCDLRPCKRKNDNKPGLYDTVNHIFYYNRGSNEFVVPQ